MEILYKEETRRGERKFSDSNIINMRARIRLLGNKYRLVMFSVLRTARHLVLAGAATYISYFQRVWFESSSKLFTTIFIFILLGQNFIINVFKCYPFQETVQYQTSYRVTPKPVAHVSIFDFSCMTGQTFFYSLKVGKISRR